MIFQSKYKGYKIWIEPRYTTYLPNGKRINNLGKLVEFENYLFKTDDEELISKLKSSPYYKIDFWTISGDKDENENVDKESEVERTKIVNTMRIAKSKLLTDCPICGRTFRTRQGLLAHIRLAHKDAEFI